LEKKKLHSHLSAAVLTTRAILGAALPPMTSDETGVESFWPLEYVPRVSRMAHRMLMREQHTLAS